jgi:hypothetical protein
MGAALNFRPEPPFQIAKRSEFREVEKTAKIPYFPVLYMRRRRLLREPGNYE